MELVSVCAWCPPPETLPKDKAVTSKICDVCLQAYFPLQAPQVLRNLQARRAVELVNPLLVPQTF